MTKSKNSEPWTFDKKQTTAAVSSLLLYNEKKKTVFLDQPIRFMLDITAFKIPSGDKHFYNICVPFSPHPTNLIDVFLIVKDVKDTDPDHVVGKVKDELLASDFESDINIRQIMTLKQFKDEFSTYEAKRMLSKSADLIIAEDVVFKCLPTILGREFYKKKKLPISIKGRWYKKLDLKAQIAEAAKKTVINISMKGQTTTLVVGHDNLSCKQLTENISKISNWLYQNYPGGWKNIAKMSLHTGNCPPLVIYFSASSRNAIEKPPTTKNKKLDEPILGEISTQPGKRIKVYPKGDIEVESYEDTKA